MAKPIPLPYHRGFLQLHTEGLNLKAILEPRRAAGETPEDGGAIVAAALAAPIASPPLRQLAAGKRKVLVVTSDHTRAMPSRITLPLLLAELRAGNPKADITILIGTGLHRPTTAEEQRAMFGDALVAAEHIVVHDAYDEAAMAPVCTLPSGAPFEVNRLAAEADLVVCEGFIEPHFFAGFSGGRKAILPGISSARSVNANHRAAAIAHPCSASGHLADNIIHADMQAAAEALGVGFILNVALDAEKRITAAFAGDMAEAHARGCAWVAAGARVEAVPGDIVVTSNGGWPLDQNLYQSPKAIATAARCAKPGAVIIMAAGCADGIGGEQFERLMTGGSPQALLERLLAQTAEETIPEQWNAQILADIMARHSVILVTDLLDHGLVRKTGLKPAATLEAAMAAALAEKEPQAEVVVIPDGVAVYVE